MEQSIIEKYTSKGKKWKLLILDNNNGTFNMCTLKNDKKVACQQNYPKRNLREIVDREVEGVNIFSNHNLFKV
jgi:hypothetical protein